MHQALLVRPLSPDVVFFRHTLAEFSAEHLERLAAREVRVIEGTVACLVVERATASLESSLPTAP